MLQSCRGPSGLAAALFVIAALLRPLPVSATDLPDWNVPDWNLPEFDSGRLLATGGVSQLEGAGGGGLVPWALISGYGTDRGIGVTVFGTAIPITDFTLGVVGAAAGFYNRVELSVAHQWFDTGSTGGKLGIGNGYIFQQTIAGAKIRLFGDTVYEQDRWWPQVAVGLQYKANDRGSLLRAIGARDDQGVDFYLAATKLILDPGLLLNATVRLTRANQLGLLGFGGDRNNAYQPQFEGSVGYLLTRHVVIGAEYRTKPSNLSFSPESNWADVFLAYFFNKHASVTVALAQLGTIANQKDQKAAYVSLQVGF